MPLYQYTVRDQTGQTRTGTTSATTEMELRGRLKAEGFHIVSTHKHEEDERPVRVFQYTVRDSEGETRVGTLAGRSEQGIEAVLRDAGYTVVRIEPAVKTWVASGDGDTYRGYVALDQSQPPAQEQQIAHLKRANRLLRAAVACLCVVVCILTFLVLHRR